MISQTDGQKDELIWGGLGNLRFLQEKVVHTTLSVTTFQNRLKKEPPSFGPRHSQSDLRITQFTKKKSVRYYSAQYICPLEKSGIFPSDRGIFPVGTGIKLDLCFCIIPTV